MAKSETDKQRFEKLETADIDKYAAKVATDLHMSPNVARSQWRRAMKVFEEENFDEKGNVVPGGVSVEDAIKSQREGLGIPTDQ